MKKITVSDKYTAFVDDDDFESVSKYKWNGQLRKNKIYARTAIYLGKTNDGRYKQRNITMHRLVMGVIDKGRNVEVDHINGNTLDNRKSNLRVCKRSENARNTRTFNQCGYRGVNIIKDKWGINYAANIQFDKKRIYLGCYKTPIEAAKAYNEAALKYHGEFARLNKF